MAVDLTITFHTCLYMLFLESFLFFAVVMQTKSQEPGTHGGVAGSFGLVFLFQALGALSLVLSEQFYPGYFSMYFSAISVACIFLAVVLCIPAAAHVAVPEAERQGMKTGYLALWVGIVCACTFLASTAFAASPDVPYVPTVVRKEALGGIVGALAVLGLAAGVRMLRQLKGQNGAFILLAGVTLVIAFGYVWTRLEPVCAQKAGDTLQPAPDACPLPLFFDHNVVFSVLLMVANVLSAEGVLRLMAAGNGAEGYAEIITVGRT